MIESKQAYGHDSMISLVEDWSPPQKPIRRCQCGTRISIYNPHEMCHVCRCKAEAEEG
jgi:hypothetical protein